MKIKQILRSSKTDPSLPAYFPGWFHERFGSCVAQISVDTTLKLRSAAKDVVRSRLGHVPEDVEELCKRFRMPPQGVSDYNFVMGYAADEGYVHGSSEPGHAGTDDALLTFIERYPDDWEIVKKSLGLARQKGRHACAYVIADRKIPDFIPMTSVSGVPVTSFTAPSVEAVGGLKMDFLVVNSLRDIQDCIRLIQERHAGGKLPQDYLNGRRVPGHRIVPLPDGGRADVWDLPEDQAVFKDVAEGRTETVFQFNTPGAVQWLAHFNYTRADGTKAIRSVEDMAAFTALDRPGPLDIEVANPEWVGPPDDPHSRHNMLVEYARRARGAPGSPDVLPILDELVPETYGVMTYQEQLQRVYQSLTGCSGPEAEEFRTNVAKKKKEKVDAAYPKFMERAGAKFGPEAAQKLWDFIKTWGQYGFNKSHAVCYAVIGYACAYLKHYYPLEWWCAVLRNADKDEVNTKFWKHCGHLVALPDIKLSGTNWFIEGDRLRAPVSLLHGVGEKAHEQLCRYAPYDSVLDLARKIKQHQDATATLKQRKVKGKEDTYETVLSPGRSAIQRKTVYTLIVAGAMDSLFPRGYSVEECLRDYDAAMTEVFGKKYTKTKKVAYPVLDPLGRYQLRKEILPAYGTDLRKLVKAVGCPEFLRIDESGKRMRYNWQRWSRAERRVVPTEVAVVGFEKLEELNHATKLPEYGFTCAVIAYVEDRKFKKYGPFKDKDMCVLTLEVGGGKYEFVHWPNGDGVLPPHVQALEGGTVVAALLVRNREDRPFSVREFKVVRPPLGTKEEDDESKETDAEG